MSEADKMFEELGYITSGTDDINFVVYDYRIGNTGFKIVFDKINKEYYSQHYDKSVTITTLVTITPEEHLAIHEKMKELQWIE